MTYTSPTTVNASAGMDSFLPYISEVTNFWFGRMLMIAIFVLFFMGYLKANDKDFIGGLAVASYVTFILGLLAWVFGIVSGLDFSVIIGVTMVSSIMLLVQKKDF